MARKSAAQASGAVCNCARSAALEQELAAEREARAAEREARAAENRANEALLEACQAERAAKEAQLQELRRDRFGRKSEVLDAGSADGAKHPESLPGEDDPDQPPSEQAAAHRDLSFADLGRLTVNDKDQICLDGKPIEVQRLSLTKWQSGFAIAASLAVVAQAVVTVLRAFKILD